MADKEDILSHGINTNREEFGLNRKHARATDAQNKTKQHQNVVERFFLCVLVIDQVFN